MSVGLHPSGLLSILLSTFNQHIGFLRLLWRTVRAEAKWTANPWEAIKRKRLVAVSRRELTVDELRRVCADAKGELRLLLALGVYTGLRFGDCATLRWAEVDLTRRMIRRIPNKTARRSGNPVVVPLHPVLLALLPGTGMEVVRGDDGKATEKHTGKRAVVEVGFHSLRHTFVSLCRESNAPLAVVEAIVGHSNPAMTRHDTHVSESAAASAVNALPAVLGDTPAPKVLPPADPLAAFKDKVRVLAEGMTPRTWRDARAELLAVAG